MNRRGVWLPEQLINMKNDGAKKKLRKRVPIRFLRTHPVPVPVFFEMGVRQVVPQYKQFRLVITATNTPI